MLSSISTGQATIAQGLMQKMPIVAVLSALLLLYGLFMPSRFADRSQPIMKRAAARQGSRSWPAEWGQITRPCRA